MALLEGREVVFVSCSYEDSIIGPVFYWISRVVKWSDLSREGGCKHLPAVNKEIQSGFLYIFSISFPKATVESWSVFWRNWACRNATMRSFFQKSLRS